MSDPRTDPIAAFYDRHPYPPPVTELDTSTFGPGADRERRAAHHLIWPERPVDAVGSVLVAGCGTSQAVRHALRRPEAHVVGVDVSAASVEHTRELAGRHHVTNLVVHQLPVEDVGQLDERFDHIVCTGVLHHLADPTLGLQRLREVLAPHGAITLMVYARYGRAGIQIMREYSRRLDIGTSAADVGDLRDTLREIPHGHPIRRLLRTSPDFTTDDAFVDALCNPRDRAYSVPELFDLLDAAGLRFGRWERQAPYLPDCGTISETPHAAHIATLPAHEQSTLLELYRGTMIRHTAIVFADDDHTSGALDFDDPNAPQWIPVTAPTAIAVEERLPPGAAVALINTSHADTDLVLFADRRQHDTFRRIDGERTVAELGDDALDFIERLWRHDLVAIDTTRADRTQ